MQSTETEVWAPVAGYEGSYEVSNFGRVRSLDRIDSAGRRLRGQLLSPHPKPLYLAVTLSTGGIHRYFYVHRLVAVAFLGVGESGEEVCHGDGYRHNNAAWNLRWGTHSENQLDLVHHGNHVNARKTHCKRGHPLAGDNLYQRLLPKRVCVECTREGQHRRKVAQVGP